MEARGKQRLLMWTLLLLSVTSVVGAAPPRLAVHPLSVVDAADADIAAYSKIFLEEFAKPKLDTVPSDVVNAWLKKRGGSCEGDDTCLAELAVATSAGRALAMSVAPYSPKIVVSIKFVTPSGDVRVTTREFAKDGDLQSAVRNGLRRAIAELEVDLTTPLLAPLIPKPPKEAPPTAVVADRFSAGRIASYACLGAAVASLAAASAVALSAQSDQNALSALLDGQGQVPRNNAQAAQLQQSLSQRSGVVTGLLVFSGVAAAAGATLFFALPAHAPVRSLAVAPLGPGVTFGGVF